MPSSDAVAPLAGAWIETLVDEDATSTIQQSHPSRVRGLKLMLK